MSLLLRITSDKAVRYSLDNGVTQTEYEPGEVYQVPDWAGASMIKRGWAKQLTAEDFDRLEAAAKAEDDKDNGGPDVDLSALRSVDKKARKQKEE
jgi:hypothetical protein